MCDRYDVLDMPIDVDLEPRDDLLGKGLCSQLSSQVTRRLSSSNGSKDCLFNLIRLVKQTHMPQHHNRTQ